MSNWEKITPISDPTLRREILEDSQDKVSETELREKFRIDHTFDVVLFDLLQSGDLKAEVYFVANKNPTDQTQLPLPNFANISESA